MTLRDHISPVIGFSVAHKGRIIFLFGSQSDLAALVKGQGERAGLKSALVANDTCRAYMVGSHSKPVSRDLFAKRMLIPPSFDQRHGGFEVSDIHNPN